MRSTKINFYLLICLAALLASCNITTTKIKEPVFIDMPKIQNELANLVKAENVNLDGKEITTNKKTTSELEVSITNGQNIPASDDPQKSLGRSIAECIKKNLKDSNEYDSYKILFVTKVESGGVMKRSWTGNVFDSREL